VRPCCARAQSWYGVSLSDIARPPGFEEAYGMSGARRRERAASKNCTHANDRRGSSAVPLQCSCLTRRGAARRGAAAGVVFTGNNVTLLDGFDIGLSQLVCARARARARFQSHAPRV
jgi:hypothetical protein